MPWSRIGRSTSTMPWSKSISITRSAITHSRPIETCWKEEIVHSCPSTVFAPIDTVPSWLRILQPWPTQDQRPSSSSAPLRTSRLHPGPTNASPSSRRRERSRSFTRPSRAISRPYFRFSIPCRRMKRSRVRRPPLLGGGGPRSSSGRSDGGAAIGSVALSMAARRIWRGMAAHRAPPGACPVRLSVLADCRIAFTIALAMTRTVLIVDDHPSFRASARMLLEAEGYEVVGEAEDGRAAIQAVHELRPDVVLLDVQLPDIDGIEVAARLTANGSAPAIVLTSSRDLADLGPLRDRCDVRGFIPKAELSGAALEALL